MADITAIALRYAEEVGNGADLDVADELFTADHVNEPGLVTIGPTG